MSYHSLFLPLKFWLTGLLPLLLAVPTLGQTTEVRSEAIQFAPGTSGTTLNASITGYESVHYTVRARAGQRMSVNLNTRHGATYFNIFEPGKGPGEAAMYIGSTAGKHFSGELPADGTYLIQVYMMRSAARRNETADYQLQVEIVSGAGSSERDFDARGFLPCSAGEPNFRRQCAFEVTRHRGGAVIRTRKPLEQSSERILRFDRNRFTAEDGRLLNGQRQGDGWWLAASDSEYYLIPDAVIEGG